MWFYIKKQKRRKIRGEHSAGDRRIIKKTISDTKLTSYRRLKRQRVMDENGRIIGNYTTEFRYQKRNKEKAFKDSDEN